jgi:hypothetical protein
MELLRLRCASHRLVAGEPTTLAFLGTSITAEPSSSGAFPAIAHALLQQHFPSANVSISVHGYPGASPMYMAACLSRMIPVRADAYILEFTDNMMGDDFTEARLAVHSIITALMARDSRAAIMLLVPFPQSCTRALWAASAPEHLRNDHSHLLQVVGRCLSPDYSAAGKFESLALESRVPYVSMRHALADSLRMHARNGTVLPWLSSFMRDAVHPNAHGHAMMATMLVDAIRRSMMTDSTDYQAPTSCAGHATTYSSSSAPEGRRTWTQATGGFANETNAVCAFGGEIQPLIQRWDGWEYVVEHSGKHRHRKPGFAAWRPGAKLDLCFSPPAAAIDRGEVFEWNLAYLRSYSQMGSARGECLRGCNCRPAVWNAHNGRARVSEHVTGTLRGIRLLRRVPSASRRCPCSIRLTVLNQTSSGGHKFKLVSVMTGFYMYSSKYVMPDAERRRMN